VHLVCSLGYTEYLNNKRVITNSRIAAACNYPVEQQTLPQQSTASKKTCPTTLDNYLLFCLLVFLHHHKLCQSFQKRSQRQRSLF